MSTTRPGLPNSISALLVQAELILREHSDSARADAEFLLAHLLGITRSRLRLSGTATLSDTQRVAFAELVDRRKQGEPVAYLTGRRGFWTLDLEVNPAVLIPRPETELLVEWTLVLLDQRFADRRQVNLQFADLGTGSGAIALALAGELPGAFVLATDISPEALELARRNAARASLVNLRFEQGSWFDALGSALRRRDGAPGARFDFLLSNPPYVAENDAHLPALRYEPIGALTSGADGLDALRQIVSGAPEHLVPGGWLLVEHGYDQGDAVRGLFEAAGFRQVQTRRDLSGQERATGGVLP